jgi:hypothetical protein
MMFKAVFVGFLMTYATFLSAQLSDTMHQHIYEEAHRCALSLLKSDYVMLRKYTHPNVIKASGGADAFLKLVSDAMTDMRDEGITIDTAYVELPSSLVVREQGEFRCIVPYKMRFKIKEDVIMSHSNLFGFSFDDGKSWCFVEAEKLREEGSRGAFFPAFKTELIIPEDRVEMTKE